MSLRHSFLIMSAIFVAVLLGMKLLTYGIVDASSDVQRERLQSISGILDDFRQMRYIVSDIQRAAYLAVFRQDEEALIVIAAQAEGFYELHERIHDRLAQHPELGQLKELIHDIVEDYKQLTIYMFALSAQQIENMPSSEVLQKLNMATRDIYADLDKAMASFEGVAVAAERKAQQYEDLESYVSFVEVAVILLMMGVVFYQLHRYVFAPLYRLVGFLLTTEKTGNLRERFSYGRSDEIGAVSHHLDQLLATLENTTVTNAELQRRIDDELKKNREKDHLLYTQARYAQMGEMLNMIAHQWRQPLQSISASTATLMVKKSINSLNEEDLEKHIQVVNRLTQQLSETINDFMTFSKPSRDPESFRLQGLIGEIIAFVGPQLTSSGIAFQEKIDDVEVLAYRKELLHVLLNLVSNAKDALMTKEGEKIITVRSQRVPDGIEITVEDNAGGIDDRIIDRVFEPYFTTKEEGKGTGIGLYMSKRIVEEMLGGALVVENVRKGARFTILLPVTEQCSKQSV